MFSFFQFKTSYFCVFRVFKDVYSCAFILKFEFCQNNIERVKSRNNCATNQNTRILSQHDFNINMKLTCHVEKMLREFLSFDWSRNYYVILLSQYYFDKTRILE